MSCCIGVLYTSCQTSLALFIACHVSLVFFIPCYNSLVFFIIYVVMLYCVFCISFYALLVFFVLCHALVFSISCHASLFFHIISHFTSELNFMSCFNGFLHIMYIITCGFESKSTYFQIHHKPFSMTPYPLLP